MNHANQKDNICFLNTALFLFAFAYALFSIGLYRVLSLTLSSTAFFVFYLSIGFSIGAGIIRSQLQQHAFLIIKIGAFFLVFLVFLFPLYSWVITHGPDPVLDAFQGTITWKTLLKQIIYHTLLTIPFFASWASVELSGYFLLIQNFEKKHYFYLFFISALLCGFVAGCWLIPCLGMLKAIYLASIVTLVGYDLLFKTFHIKSSIKYFIMIFLFFSAGSYEKKFIEFIYPEGPNRVGSILKGYHYFTGEKLIPPAQTKILEQKWGKYCLFSLIDYHESNKPEQVLGCYDGAVLWPAQPDIKYPFHLDDVAFSLLSSQSDICLLGSGGGSQVSRALNYNPNHIVAVDIIPDVFDALKGALAWTNGFVYQNERVETIAADGRYFLEHCSRKFDLIMLPNTESWAAILKSLFEPGLRVHTLESFQAMKKCLKPNGMIAIIKGVDRHNRLFNLYAQTLQEAGYCVTGYVLPLRKKPLHLTNEFLLLAYPNFHLPKLKGNAQQFVQTHCSPPVFFSPQKQTDFIQDSSPWIMGYLGNLFEKDLLQKCLWGTFLIALIVILIFFFLSLKLQPSGGQSSQHILICLASLLIGINFISLENALIFSLIPYLLNSLSSFFIGTALFLVIVGSAQILYSKSKILWLFGIISILFFIISSWNSKNILSLIFLLGIVFSSATCFPMLCLHYKSKLSTIYIIDSLGSLIGGLLGIWIPVFLGSNIFYFSCVLTALATIITTWVAIKKEKGV